MIRRAFKIPFVQEDELLRNFMATVPVDDGADMEHHWKKARCYLASRTAKQIRERLDIDSQFILCAYFHVQLAKCFRPRIETYAMERRGKRHHFSSSGAPGESMGLDRGAFTRAVRA